MKPPHVELTLCWSEMLFCVLAGALFQIQNLLQQSATIVLTPALADAGETTSRARLPGAVLQAVRIRREQGAPRGFGRHTSR